MIIIAVDRDVKTGLKSKQLPFSLNLLLTGYCFAMPLMWPSRWVDDLLGS